MDQLQVQHLNNLSIHSTCRTCLDNFDEMHHNVFGIPDFEKKFTACTSLCVKPSDGLPTSLCESCYTKIEDFYNFQLMCISAEIQFQDYINPEKKLSTSELDVDSSNSPNGSKIFTEAKQVNINNSLIKNELLKLDEVETLFDVNTKSEFSIEEIQENPPVSKNESDENNSINGCSFKIESAEACTETFEEYILSSVQIPSDSILEGHELESDHAKSDLESNLSEEDMPTNHSKIYKSKANTKKFNFPRTRQKVAKEIKNKSVPEKNLTSSEPGCHKNPSSKRSFREHIAEALGDTADNKETNGNGKPHPYACTECQMRFMTKFRLIEHMNRHAGIKNYECPHCGVKKTSRNEMKVHINYHAQEKTYPCGICLAVFYTTHNLNRHKRVVHDGIKKYPCSLCGKEFGTSTSRNNHEKVHSDERPHDCTICKRRYIHTGKFKQHMKNHHPEGQTHVEIYTCVTCGKTFNNAVNLDRHQRTVHEGIKKFFCSFCGKAYGTLVTKDNHEKLHTGEKLHDCKICEKQFITLAALDRHEKIHTAKKPHKCDVCQKSFASISHLNRHANVHLRASEEINC